MSALGQVVHVLRKDVRRFWPHLVGVAVWVALWAWSVPDVLSGTPGVVGVVSSGLTPILLAAVAGLVVLEDRAAGARGFWLGLPLAPGAVLVAKLLFVGLFLLLLPAAVQVVEMVPVTSGASPGRLLADALIHGGGLLALVVLAASVTARLSTFAGVIVAGVVGMAVVGASPLGSGPVDPTLGSTLTTTYLLRIVWLVGGIGLAAHQLLTRRTARTVALGVVLLAGTEIVVPRLGLDATSAPSVPTAPPSAVGDSVQLRIGSVRVRPAQGLDAEGRLELQIQMIGEVPRPLSLGTGVARVTLRGADGSALLEVEEGLTLPRRGPSVEGLEGYVPVDVRPRRGGSPPAQVAFIRATAADSALHGALDAADALEVDVRISLLRPVLLATLPLEDGAAALTREGRIELRSWGSGPSFVRAEVVRTRGVPALAAHGVWERDAEPGLALLHPGEGAAVSLPRTGTSASTATLVGGSRLARSRLEAEMTQEPGRRTVPHPTWLAGARLGIVGTESAGSVHRVLRTEVPETP